MPSEPLKIGIVGCGKQAPKHIDGLRSDGRAVEISAFDTDPAALAALARQKKVAMADSLRAMLDDAGIEAVIVAVPTPHHHDVIVAALRTGKHVFCEKPLCATVDEAEKIREVSRETGRFVQVGYVYRFVPAFRFIRDTLADAEQPLGRPVLAIMRLGGRGSHSAWKHRRDAGGGAINEMLVHILDLAGWLFGPIENAKWHEALLLRPERVIDGALITADAEDFVLVSGRSRDGVHVLLEADLVTPTFQQYVELQGENGTFVGSIQSDHPAYLHLIEARGAYAAGRKDLAFPQENLFHSQMQNFLGNIERGGARDCATVDDTLSVFEMMEQVRAS